MKKSNFLCNFEIVINELSPRRTTITWTNHFAIPSLLECFVLSERPLFCDPEIRCQTHHLAKLITRTIILKTTLLEFPLVRSFVRTENCKKNFIHFSMLIRPMIIRDPIGIYIFCILYPILGLSRAKNKIKLAYIVMVSCASHRSLAK